jgi:hypothetical protein
VVARHGGGNAARPDGALEWAARLAAREPQLEAQLARARAAGDDPERAGLARTARELELERLLGDLRAARPAIEALVDVARLVVQKAPLAVLWPALRDFLAAWLLQPGAGARVHALLDERLANPRILKHLTDLTGVSTGVIFDTMSTLGSLAGHLDQSQHLLRALNAALIVVQADLLGRAADFSFTEGDIASSRSRLAEFAERLHAALEDEPAAADLQSLIHRLKSGIKPVEDWKADLAMLAKQLRGGQSEADALRALEDVLSLLDTDFADDLRRLYAR